MKILMRRGGVFILKTNPTRTLYFGHKPFGCQSFASVIHGWDASCSTSKTDRRVSFPTLDSAIGGPSGTTAPSPARAMVMPSGVSRHWTPETRNHASGPECRCTGLAYPG
jgi:hypothetical protein